MAYKISKSDSAPEGDLKLSVEGHTYKVPADAPYETDDLVVVEAARQFPEFFAVEDPYAADGSVRAAAREEEKERRDLAKAQAAAKKQRAVKDPLEPAAEIPDSREDLKETE